MRLAKGIVIGVVLSGTSGAFAGTMTFTDQTNAAGLAVTHDNTHMAALWPPAVMMGGGAAGDFDRDGDQDLFYIGGDSPDRLFINDGNGNFTDEAAAWGVDDTHMGLGVSVADFNADGWLDIYVTSIGPTQTTPAIGQHKLYRNNGDGTFTDIAVSAGVATTSTTLADGWSPAFGDYDLDGDLDLFVTSWRAGSGGNKLFRNNGNETFTDVTAAAGIEGTLATVQGFTPRFVDMDGDLYPELLVAADFGTSKYFVNNGDGTFTDQTVISGTGLDGNGMGQTIGDFDSDGLIDWYVTSIYESDPTEWPATNVPGDGNMLYMCIADHQFLEDGEARGVRDGGWGWGTVAVDFDHDLDQDLIEVNGWILTFTNEQVYLWENDGTGHFTERAVASGVTAADVHRGCVTADFDGDGDQDTVVLGYGTDLKYYRNEIDQQVDTNWLRIFLDTSARPTLAPDGFGSKVWITVGGQSYMRSVDGGNNYLSQSELSAHFGLGANATVDSVTVEWADGTTTALMGVSANQTLTIAAHACAGDVNGDGGVDVNDISYVLFRLGGTTDGDANGDSTVDVNDISYVLFRLGGCSDT